MANQNVVTNEDVVLNGNLPTTDADGAVTYAVITNQATTNGTVSVAANGSYTYTPNANYSGSDSFVVNVTDAQGFTTPVTVNVTVNPIDDGSVANQNVVTNEDVVLNGNLPTTDADGAVTYAVITNQATTNGTVSVAANGSYTYTPNANYSGSDSFVVNVTDAQGFTTPVTVNVTVNPIDDGSVANQNVVTNEDVVLNGNLPTTDADGAVTYAVITNQATTNGTVSVAANGSYTYTPNANYSGSDSFVVNVTDAQGFTTPVTVNVTVNPIDDGSVANQNVVTNEDVVLNGNLPTTDADGAVTYAVITNQATTNGTVSVAANGSYTYTPNANYSGSDSFVVNVTDAQGFTTPVTVNVTVNPIDDGSVANQNVVTNEDVVLNGNLPTTDADGAVTYAVITNQATTNGTVSVAANGSYTYTPNANYSGSDSFVVNVTDAQGFTTPVTVNVTVNPIDDGSVANQNVVTNEDVVLNGNLPTTDADGAVTYAVITNQATTNGTVSVAANGSYTYTPNANYSGSDSFVVNVTDAQGFTTPVTVNVTVNPIDDGSVATQNVVTNEDVVLNGNLPTTDADGAVTYAVITNQATTNGTVSVAANGSYTYTPNANYSGSDSFVVNVTDAQGFVTPVTVNVTVNPIDDGSVANQNVVTNEDVVLNGNLPTTDADGAVTYAVITNQTTTNGTVSVAANGSYTYTPNANYSGSDSFVVNVTDAQGFVTPVTVNVTVNPIDDGAVANQNVVTNEDVVLNGNLPTTDADGAVTYAVITNQATTNGTVSVAANGSYTYTPNANYSGSDSFTVNVTDAQGFTTPATVNVTVNPINDAPITTTANLLVNEEAQNVSLGIVAPTDVDSASLTITVSGLPNIGVVTLANGTAITVGQSLTIAELTSLQYDAPMEVLTTTNTSFTYTVSDGVAPAITGVANITVNPVNDAPIANDDPEPSLATTPVGLLSEYFGYQEGVDGGNLSNLAQVTTFINGRTPDATFTATEFRYGLDDLFGNNLGNGTNLQLFLGADAASLSADPGTTTDAVIRMRGYVELDAGTYNFRVRGDDGYQIKIDGVVVAQVNAIQPPTGTVHTTFTVAESGFHQIEVLYWDQGGQAVFQAEISNNSGSTYQFLSQIPTVSTGVFNLQEDNVLTITPSSLLANDSDIDGDVLSVLSVGNATHGTVSINGSGDIIFTPQLNYSGPASFEYTVSDGNGGTDVAKVAIYISPVNDAPTATGESFSTNEDAALTLTPSQLLTNDSDIEGDVLTISSVQGAVNGTVALVGSNVVFTPTANYNGPASFTYTVSDGNGGSSTATVNVTVNSVNDAPSGINQSVSLVEDKAYTFTLSDFSFSDVDNNSLNAVRITAVPGTGTVFLNNVAITSGTTVAVADIVAGRLVYLPSLNSNLSRTMTFQVQDDGGTANGGVNLDQSANVLTLNITADANDINAGGTSTTQTLALNVGNISINDNGGAADLINITSTGAPSFSAFNFERFGNNLEYQATSGANNTHVTVINEYVAGNKIEAISFTGGGDYSSYSLGTAAYSINTTATGIADVQEILAGSSIDDTLTGGGGTSSDMLFGGAGNDTLTTTGSGTHLLVGGSGNDTLTGGTGADVLLGGSGNDSLTGGAGVDVFVWKLADKGIAGSPATDTVADFTESATDKLNISDLLQGENSGNLTNYLHLTYDSGTNATTVHISSSGGYSSGFSNSLTDQTIVLSNYNPGSTSDATIISNLIAANKLITD
ncbi:MAG: tandem-95 repeat protein [Cellvibrio sp.]|nr:tandem-95 repeat protein [Cellvibrio sp.]